METVATASKNLHTNTQFIYTTGQGERVFVTFVLGFQQRDLCWFVQNAHSHIFGIDGKMTRLSMTSAKAPDLCLILI